MQHYRTSLLLRSCRMYVEPFEAIETAEVGFAGLAEWTAAVGTEIAGI